MRALEDHEISRMSEELYQTFFDIDQVLFIRFSGSSIYFSLLYITYTAGCFAQASIGHASILNTLILSLTQLPRDRTAPKG